MAIARALVLEPDVLILDETLTGLDHREQSALLELFARLQRSRGLTYVLISHDLAMIRHACDRTAVMYLGRIVEQGSTARIFTRPAHPYTRALLAALLTIETNPFRRQTTLLEGAPWSPTDLPAGCSFANRCPLAQECCTREDPPERASDRATVACYFPLVPAEPSNG